MVWGWLVVDDGWEPTDSSLLNGWNDGWSDSQYDGCCDG